MASKSNLKGGGMIHEAQWNFIASTVCTNKAVSNYGYLSYSGTVGTDRFNQLCTLIGAPANGFRASGSGTVPESNYNALVDYVAANF